MYIITKLFISGPLEGITIKDITSVFMEPNKEYSPCVGASKYKVISCVEVK